MLNCINEARHFQNGKAPDRILAAVNPANPALDDLTPAIPLNRTRPLCAYPDYARYAGAGSIDDAANFKCARLPSAHEH